jgi:hypothetical protein
MGWSGRAPAPPAIEARKGRHDKEHAMSQTLNAAIARGWWWHSKQAPSFGRHGRRNRCPLLRAQRTHSDRRGYAQTLFRFPSHGTQDRAGLTASLAQNARSRSPVDRLTQPLKFHDRARFGLKTSARSINAAPSFNSPASSAREHPAQ